MAFSANLFAEPEPQTVTAELRVSYFRPSSPLLRSIYGKAGMDYQLTGTVPVTCFFDQPSYDSLKGINLWWAVDYFAKNGHSVGEEPIKTSLWMLPVTAGLKYIYSSTTIRPYLGLGLRYFFVQTSNDSEYVQKHTYKNGLGGVVEGGILLPIGENFLFDVFATYSHGKLRPPSNAPSNVKTTSLQAGGLNLGIGVSYAF